MKGNTVANASLDFLGFHYVSHAAATWQVPTRLIVIVKDDASVMMVDSAHASLMWWVVGVVSVWAGHLAFR